MELKDFLGISGFFKRSVRSSTTSGLSEGESEVAIASEISALLIVTTMLSVTSALAGKACQSRVSITKGQHWQGMVGQVLGAASRTSKPAAHACNAFKEPSRFGLQGIFDLISLAAMVVICAADFFICFAGTALWIPPISGIGTRKIARCVL